MGTVVGSRIFVTGATGFIGRHVVERLVGYGARLRLGVREINRCPASWASHPAIEMLESPHLISRKVIEEGLRDAHAVIHLAGLAHLTGADPGRTDAQFMISNAQFTEVLAESAAAADVRAFIHLSSLAAITSNAADGIVNDASREAPLTPYGRSKLEAERHVRDLAGRGVFAVSLRPPLVVGAEAPGNWARLQALAASGLPLPFASVDNKRCFVSVQTLSRAVQHLALGNWPANLSGEYCVCDPEALSLATLMRELRRGMGIPDRLFPVPVSALRFLGTVAGRQGEMNGLTGNLELDPSRFFRTFGFDPELDIREAVRQSGATYAETRRNRR